MSKIRTRFAPSPTGFMHIGGVRTALFAWAFARHEGGRFILRIEDTDKEREVSGSLPHILESLRWLGLAWDEGPGSDDQSHGPYIQSERLDIYRQWAQKLIDNGLAYADPYSNQQLQKKRHQAQQQNRPFLYRDYRPEVHPPPDDWYGRLPIRFLNTMTQEPTVWRDEVRGEMRAGTQSQDDFIIVKADGYPTYNFAHVIDDHLMQISHVMRGEEFIASTPKFIALHQALGITLPKFVTLPPILSLSGGKKLSKRDGAKDVLQYRQEGYLPEALVNFLSSLGWNDGTEDEIFTPAQIVKRFSLARIQKSGARFDQRKLDWISGHHIRRFSLGDLADKIEPGFWPLSAKNIDTEYRLKVLDLVKDRLKYFGELSGLTDFFFVEPTLVKEQLVDKLPQESAHRLFESVLSELRSCDFTVTDLENRLRQLAADLNVSTGDLFKLIRLAVTGRHEAPGLFETLSVLGSERSLRRLRKALKLVKN